LHLLILPEAQKVNAPEKEKEKNGKMKQPPHWARTARRHVFKSQKG